MNVFETIEDLKNIYAEMHKDAYGTKGRWIFSEDFTVVQLLMKIDNMQLAVDATIAEEKAAEEAAVIRFEKLLNDTVAMGAGNHETALKWLRDGGDHYEPAQMEWSYGLPFGWITANFPDMVASRYHWADGFKGSWADAA